MKASKFVVGGRYKYNRAAVAAGFSRSSTFKFEKLLIDGSGAFREDGGDNAICIELRRLKRTPCTKLGYVEGDVFIVREDGELWKKGQELALYKDDGTTAPFFTTNAKDSVLYANTHAIYLPCVEKKEL